MKQIKKLTTKTLFLAVVFAFLALSTVVFASVPSQKIFAEEVPFCNFQNAKLKDVVSDRTQIEFNVTSQNIFKALANQKVQVTVEASLNVQNLKIYANNGVEVSGGNDLDSPITVDQTNIFSKEISCATAGEYAITVVGEDVNGNDFFDTLSFIVFDKINNATISIDDKYVTESQLLDVNFVYNEAIEVQTNNDISVTIKNDNSQFSINKDNFTTFNFVKSFNKLCMQIDTSLLPSDFKQFNLSVSCQDIEASTNVEIQNLTLPADVYLGQSNVAYYLQSGDCKYHLYLSEQSKPLISLKSKNNSISLIDYYKVESDRVGYDKIELILKTNKAVLYDTILCVVQGISGEIINSFNVSVVDKIDKIELIDIDNLYDYESLVTIDATINGLDNFASNLEWYVNDVKVENATSQFKMIFQGGTYNVYAKIGDVQSNTITFTVKYAKGDILFWYIVLAVSVVLIILLVITRKKKGHINLFGTLTDNLADLKTELDSLQVKFTKAKMRKVYANMALIMQQMSAQYYKNDEQMYMIAFEAVEQAYTIIKKLIFRKKETQEERVALLKQAETNIIEACDALYEYKRLCGISD